MIPDRFGYDVLLLLLLLLLFLLLCLLLRTAVFFKCRRSQKRAIGGECGVAARVDRLDSVKGVQAVQHMSHNWRARGSSCHAVSCCPGAASGAARFQPFHCHASRYENRSAGVQCVLVRGAACKHPLWGDAPGEVQVGEASRVTPPSLLCCSTEQLVSLPSFFACPWQLSLRQQLLPLGG